MTSSLKSVFFTYALKPARLNSKLSKFSSDSTAASISLPGSGGNLWVVAANSKNKDLAYDWIDATLDPKVQTIMGNEGGLPVNANMDEIKDPKVAVERVQSVARAGARVVNDELRNLFFIVLFLTMTPVICQPRVFGPVVKQSCARGPGRRRFRLSAGFLRVF